MTDTLSNQTTDDVGPSDAVETPQVEETQDTDVDLEDIEVSLDELEGNDETEESEETESDEAATESDTEETEESSEDVESEELPKDSKEKEDEAERKRVNDEAARRRIAEKQAREAERQRQQQEYIQGAETDQDLALRQLQVDAYNNKVQFNSDRLQNGIDKAIASIDLFRTGNDEVKEELARSLNDFEQMYVTYDQNGDPVDVRGDVYQFLQDKAASIRKLTGLGARQEATDKKLTKARTETLPNKTPKEPKKDQDLDDFDSAW